MNPNELIIRYEQVDAQSEGPVKRLVGFVRARNLLSLFDAADLEANPRSAKVGSVTADIIESIQKTPELLPFKTKGILIASANCTEMERRRYRLVFENTASEGILDGGHNTLAIGLHILGIAGVDPKVIRKIRTWSDFKNAWEANRELIDELKAKTRSGDGGPLDFLVPVEALVPSDPDNDILMDQFTGSLLEIGAARNNNVQLTLETKANKKGFYEEIRKALPKEIADRVEWKTNDGGEVKVRDLVAFAWIPLSLIKLPESVSAPTPQNLYRNKGACTKAFDDLMSDVTVSKATGGDYIHELHNSSVASALRIAGELPALYDLIYELFPAAYNGNSEGRFGRLAAVKMAKDMRSKPVTPFFKRPVEYTCPDGYVMPIMYGLKVLMETDANGHVFWKTNPQQFIETHLPGILRTYRPLFEAFNSDPQKIGKSEGSYLTALNAFETELLRLQHAA